MDYPILSIAGIRFFEPVVAGLNFDVWIDHVEIIIGETSSPYSWENPKYYKFTFFHVIEFRGFTDCQAALDRGIYPEKPITKDEIDIFSQRDVTDSETKVDQTNNMAKVLTNTSFRDPDQCGRSWTIPRKFDRIYLFCLNYMGYIEFLYTGQIIAQELSEEDSLKEWKLQWDAYAKVHPKRHKSE